MDLFDDIPRLESARLVLREFVPSDAPALTALAASEAVYRFLPTFLYEQKYDDATQAIERLRAECLETGESVLWAIYVQSAPDEMLGIAEAYNLGDEKHKVSIGYRLAETAWGKGIATETVAILKDYLLNTVGLDIITAHVMVDNTASANVLLKNGFALVASNVLEDWGRGEPVHVEKYVFVKR